MFRCFRHHELFGQKGIIDDSVAVVVTLARDFLLGVVDEESKLDVEVFAGVQNGADFFHEKL